MNPMLPDVVYVYSDEGLHPDTAPDEIARVQRADVRRAIRELGAAATPEAISESVVLPVGVVAVRIKELAGDYSGHPRARKPPGADTSVHAALKRFVSGRQKRFASRAPVAKT